MFFRLYADDYFECRLDRVAGLASLVRSSEPFAALEVLEATFVNLNSALSLVPRERMGLLIDARAAPSRLSLRLNEAFERHRVQITLGFAAVAVLVRTAVGGAQVRRISRDDPVEHAVFHDEERALDYLRRALSS